MLLLKIPLSILIKKIKKKSYMNKLINSNNVNHSLYFNFNDFRNLATKYGSDKSWLDGKTPNKPFQWHEKSYFKVYETIVPDRERIKKIIEVGIGSNDRKSVGYMGDNYRIGASLRLLRDFFPKAQVVGIDIDPGLMFRETCIKTFVVDQLDVYALNNFAKRVKGNFDLIIDDGLHEITANIITFEALSPLLNKSHGLYVIEDVNYINLDNYISYFNQRKAKFVVHSSIRSELLFDDILIVVYPS